MELQAFGRNVSRHFVSAIVDIYIHMHIHIHIQTSQNQTTSAD